MIDRGLLARMPVENIVPFDLNSEKLFIFDFTENNSKLRNSTISNVNEFSRFIKTTLRKNGRSVGIGRYNENRVIYHSKLFDGQEKRTIHLGIDLWLPARTTILCPLQGIIHSFQNNSANGDYGPTIIVEHTINGARFYTLYGHLSVDSLNGLKEGQEIQGGSAIGRIGNSRINGGWPPHLHFQIIQDMQGKKGDFPGVACFTERKKYLRLCPNPNTLLRINAMNLPELNQRAPITKSERKTWA